jgi:hypothetical protein
MAEAYDWNKLYTGAGRGEREIGIRGLGYTGAFGQGNADKWLTDNFKTTDLSKIDAPAGVKQLSVASQTPYQKDALYSMGQASKPVDSRISGTYDRALDATQQTARPFDSGSYKQFMNPYLDEVIGNNAADIRRSYDTSRNNIDEAMASAGAFGSTAQGVERSRANEAEARQIGDMSAGLRSQGFSNAMGNALGLYNTDSSNALSRAGMFGNLAGSMQNLDQYGRSVSMTDQDRKLQAGNQIQSQNQRELDAYFAERQREQRYPYDQLELLRGVLGAYPTGQTQTSSSGGGSGFGDIFGGAAIGSSIFNNMGGGGGGGFDWAGVVPSSGIGPQQPWYSRAFGL